MPCFARHCDGQVVCAHTHAYAALAALAVAYDMHAHACALLEQVCDSQAAALAAYEAKAIVDASVAARRSALCASLRGAVVAEGVGLMARCAAACAVPLPQPSATFEREHSSTSIHFTL